MGKLSLALREIIKSKFVRSMFLRVMAIFLVVSVAVVAIVFFSFAAEMNKSIIADKQKQLSVIENSISQRMDEVTSIAYNIGADSAFFLEPLETEQHSGYEMSTTLGRYLVGNGFIEHLAYYRLAEPDRLYTSRGEISFHAFWNTYLDVDNALADELIAQISALKRAAFSSFTFDRVTYLTYVCPLPQLSANPQAFVLVMISADVIKPLFDSQLADSTGAIAVFDSTGRQLYRVSSPDLGIELTADGAEEEYTDFGGKTYVVQRQKSATNGWTYVSAIRLNDITSGLANRQIVFVVLLLLLMFLAVFVILVSIVVQYKPIRDLAASVNEGEGGVTDERELLSSTFDTLRQDSEQKRKFENAYYEAEAANKAKSIFLSSMSHDIRTPMNAIIGMTAIALKNPDDPDHVKECLGKVQVASQYLLDVINNVLDMSRIESGKFTLTSEVVELPELIYGLMTILNQSMQARQQRLVVRVDNIRNEKVMGDSVRIMQVFMNILSNSVKFTPRGGTISLNMTQNDGEYVFVFSDTGIGMSPEFVEHVFDTFSRAGIETVARSEGTGLGMAIAKSLVELMGGSIICESELNKGTTFTVRLPLTPADTAPQIDTGKYSKMRVLIVGGRPDTRQAETSAFAAVGAQSEDVATLADGCEKIRRAAEENRPYRLVMVNRSALGESENPAALTHTADCPDTIFILCSKDLLNIKQAEVKRAGIDAIVQLPLFTGTVLRLLDGKTDTQNRTERPQSGIPDFTGRRILVAEDNILNREIANRIISETHAELCEAVNGREAVEIYTGRPEGYFDVVLMDLQMPVMDGFEAVAAIRASGRADAQSLPIYALSASTFDEDVRQVRDAGMNGHIGKPYMPETLFAVLEQAFGNK